MTPTANSNFRYEVHRQVNGDFILWDTFTNAQVEFAGPYQSATDATRRAFYYNRAWAALPTLFAGNRNPQ